MRGYAAQVEVYESLPAVRRCCLVRALR
jgi:hypothetical protein